MKVKSFVAAIAATVISSLAVTNSHAQKLREDFSEEKDVPKIQKFDNGVAKKGEWYFSWGYNKEWYTGSDLHIKQPSLGNDYVIKDVRARDKPGWDHGLFKKDLSIPQYNYRLGYFFKDNWAFEINFDHAKYVIDETQLLHVKGTIGGQQVDEYIANNVPTYNNNTDPFIKYQLNNGANFLMFNIVHNIHLSDFNKKWFDLSFMWKAGPGIMIPHVENTIQGNKNHKGFQFGGFGADVEGAVRATFFKYAYLEFANKVVGTHYYNLRVYEGKAKQTFGTYMMVLSAGVKLPQRHHK